MDLIALKLINMIVIPQAMRVIIPPTISQFLNLTKNSSLAVAVGYEEIVAVWAGISSKSNWASGNNYCYDYYCL